MDSLERPDNKHNPQTTSARHSLPVTGLSALDALRGDFDFSDMPDTDWLEREQSSEEPDTRALLLPDPEHP